jgi:23S rRNA (adenine2503-C2)-methyltransferase
VASSPPHLLGLFPEELVACLRAEGLSAGIDEARRVIAHAVTRGLPGYPRSRPVPKALERAVDRLTDRRPIEIVERADNPGDGFVKYLFRLPDGALAEAVRIPLEVPGRFTVCVSSQVGCAMGCRFCATARLGFGRHLAAWEIVAQVLAVRAEAPGRVTGVVFQGQGEPLHNYDAVMRAAAILSHPCGGCIAGRAITVSTVGVVPGIERMARETHPYRLIVSLTSAIEEKRRRLIPTAVAWPVDEIAEAAKAYQRAKGERLTIAWVLLGGVNHGADEIEALDRLFRGVPLRFNIIDVNDSRPDGFRRATEVELDAFRDALWGLGFPVVRRYSGGFAKHAACGMLAAVRDSLQPPAPSLITPRATNTF